MKYKALLLCCCVTFATGCSHRIPNELTQISNLKAPHAESTIDDLRLQSVKEAAATLGAQSGLTWRMAQINQIVSEQGESLNRIFDFRQLMLAHQVIPPVLVTADNIVNIGHDEALRVAEKTYAIVAPPKFSASPPSWQSYLLAYFPKPETPDVTLLPKNKFETEAWNSTIVKNWEIGVNQANAIFQSNLSRLKRDFNGMILYKKLLSQKMITPPFIAETNLGITGSPEEIRLNDRIIRISKTSSLVTNPEKWQSAIKSEQK